MPRLNAEQWLSVRADYEVYPDMTFRQLAKKHGVSKSAIAKRAKKKGWRRDITGKAMALAVARSVQEVDELATKKEIAISAYSDKLFRIMEKHKVAWEKVDLMIKQAIIFDEDGTVIDTNFDLSKSAKITSETLAIKQKNERQAWGIETESPKIQVNTQVNTGKDNAEPEIDWNALSDSELETMEKLLKKTGGE